MYKFLLYLHILSVMLSVGPFFVLIPLLSRIRTASSELLPAYLTAFHQAVTLSKHAGHVLVITGATLVWTGGWSWLTPWIVSPIVIMFAALSFIARAFSPILKEFADPSHDRRLLVARLSRAVWLYILIMLVMMWFMVAKPALWAA